MKQTKETYKLTSARHQNLRTEQGDRHGEETEMVSKIHNDEGINLNKSNIQEDERNIQADRCKSSKHFKQKTEQGDATKKQRR